MYTCCRARELHMCWYAYLLIYTYTCLYICIYICIYIHIYIYINILFYAYLLKRVRHCAPACRLLIRK